MLSDRDRRILRELEDELQRSDQRFVSTFVLRTHKSSVEQPWRFTRSITGLAVVTVLLLLFGFASIALVAGAVLSLLVLLAVVQQGPRRGFRPGEPRS
ncbi:DUF3040 domain-containing protein [Pseudonocardia sp. KRD-184]|uniref:DUF3040 domain-containing protein n=1 Tax=Pseudonocardia oceani TaxID=2792013 RepID=A0ABS6U918_9PSEU|nr:DUF3040 domain-containing protein [Pseudonocardia oceani]MBW0088651.1 DUF3040 domain-containing protein [Pseudonocardia oceani]MBW0095529.1 DUF3040 domain-containing protein [Pseudonocardia oceani]MBW0108490.1 DUF3040 domain-containing protein [Pseudonocardia oceani]MBW0121540.1 DUF3040 domain-containing protein [Pseudonocardia oceani]MBW0128721.1 DUF3040 domain-containing protein [Pseudonocardia oceani]